jgi:1-acyl-sn-glycerol-3-phosphate acyltransferase
VIYSIAAVVSWPAVRLLYRYRAYGKEHLPREGGFVLAAGHLSNFDPWPLGLALWPRRFLRFMAKAELFWFPLSAVMRGGGAFKVQRGASDREAVKTAIDLARAGHVVAMFPEGTRRRKRKGDRVFTGAARIAIEAGVPLVPAGIKGTDGLARFAPLRVRYGAPIELGDLRDRAPAEGARIATNRLMTAIGELEESL